jgi:hypothetical protein
MVELGRADKHEARCGGLPVSQKPLPPLHIEWTPGFARAVNITTGQSAEASAISALGPILNGQSQALVGVGHSHIFLKSVRLPKATAQDTRNILGVQIGQMFPLPADQLSFDFIQTEDQTVDGWLTVVGAIRSNDLREIRADCLLSASCLSHWLRQPWRPARGDPTVWSWNEAGPG